MRFSVYKKVQVNEIKIQEELQKNELNQNQNMKEYDKVQQNLEKQIIESLNNQDELLQKRKMYRKLRTQVMIKINREYYLTIEIK
ncbi:unnamed protein product [Paramecium sonneborni]|uniref:Uncharacterized protein n=1 Tax=Paramecium sonneborni TaxID=65129 RepID=A0A8S1MYY8_9CILI|nr:unnamed protein product [Paramecium sonneborni]CAD8083351.1 unnamed protein product [Paramecium sonneborni]